MVIAPAGAKVVIVAAAAKSEPASVCTDLAQFTQAWDRCIATWRSEERPGASQLNVQKPHQGGLGLRHGNPGRA